MPESQRLSMPIFNVILGEAVESDTEFYVKQQQQGQGQPPIVQPEDPGLRRPPVYFGDRFPVSPNQQHSSSGSRVPIQDEQGDQGQFHLYGLQLGELQLKIIYFFLTFEKNTQFKTSFSYFKG